VMRVRNLFPDPNDQYTGFKSKKKRKKWIICLFLFSELLWQMRSSQTSSQTRSQRCLLQSVVAYSGVTATDPGTLPCHRDQPAARMERIPSTKTAFSWCRWELWWRCSGRQIHYLICSIFSNCGSGFRIPDPDPGFDEPKWEKIYSWKFKSIFWIKNWKLLIPRPP
jgi:hypothetical protein